MNREHVRGSLYVDHATPFRILHKAAHDDRQINIHQLSESFSMETIGSCVFGVRAGCFECIDSEFIGDSIAHPRSNQYPETWDVTS